MATELHSEIFRGIEYKYYHNNSTVTLNDALTKCKNLGSELAYMKDVDTWNKIIEFLPEVKSDWWIGLRRKDGNSTWKWLDGTEYELEEDILGSDMKYIHCGTMQVHDSVVIIQGRVCKESVYDKYICQREIPPNPSTATRVATTTSVTNSHTNFEISTMQGITSATTPSRNNMQTGIIIGVAVSVALLLLAIAFLVWRYKVKQKRNSKPPLEVSYTSCHATSNDVGDYAEINTAQSFDPCSQTVPSNSAYDHSLYATADELQVEFREVVQPPDNIQPQNSDTAGTSEQVTYAQVNKPRKTNDVQPTITGDVYAQVNKSK